MFKSMYLWIFLFFSPQLLAQTCELDTKEVEENEYSIYNPFTACIDDLKIPGLPEDREKAWKMMLKKGGVKAQLVKVVCESIYDAAKDELKDIFKDVIDRVSNKTAKVDVKDVVKYCKKNPEICLAGSKSSNGQGDGPAANAPQTGYFNPNSNPNLNANDNTAPNANGAPSWGGWGQGQPSPSSNPLVKAAICQKKPWLCPKPVDKNEEKPKQNERPIEEEDKYKIQRKKY